MRKRRRLFFLLGFLAGIIWSSGMFVLLSSPSLPPIVRIALLFGVGFCSVTFVALIVVSIVGATEQA